MRRYGRAVGWQLDEFVRSLTAASPNTVAAYRRDVTAFADWAERAGLDGPVSGRSAPAAPLPRLPHDTPLRRAAPSPGRRRRCGGTSAGSAAQERGRRSVGLPARALGRAGGCRGCCGPTS